MALDHDTHRPPRALRTFAWRLGTLALAGVLLASCSPGASKVVPVSGVPSIGISVPLQQVACTLNDSCVVVGASSAGVGPSTVGEYRQASGHWAPLVLPPAAAAQFTSTSCWANDCLLAGAQSTGDLLWDYQGSSHILRVLSPPAGGVDVAAVDCFAASSCVALDIDAHGLVRLVSTLDGGATWTSPVALDWAGADTVTTVACHSSNDCLVGATTPNDQAVLEVTHDAGLTWTPVAVPSRWTAFRALTCRVRSCVGLVSTSDGSRIVHTATFGRIWHVVTVPAQGAALACSSLQHCVAVGQTSTGSPWLAQFADKALTPRPLRYVPTPLTDVACGTTICAAIGATTLVSLAP